MLAGMDFVSLVVVDVVCVPYALELTPDRNGDRESQAADGNKCRTM